MKAFHNSHDKAFRNPFGAVPTDAVVSLRLDVWDCGEVAEVKLWTWMDGMESYCDMKVTKEGECFVCRAELKMPAIPCLFWYCFLIEADGEKMWYLNNQDKLGGIGRCEREKDDKHYQITVYDKEFEVPSWFCERVMYQIFPDRFCGEHNMGEIRKTRDDYIIHYDRYEPISHNRHMYENGPACNDFYGGNLKGIIEKLPYIKSLGVGVIYLNPIFEAYSNHKYDTANYKAIDPMFGDEGDFSALCAKAEEYGIRIILDGVFSHTGADSVYFNKYKNYGEGGAYNDVNSPYRNWYQFRHGQEYNSWWGCSNLPNVNEMAPSYLDYILRDDDSVIKKWLRLGAAGWRLDVADELPDEFISILRKEAKSVKSDAIIIGEVWEDASNKIAYGKRRNYLLGYELDSVMNYPFMENVTKYIMACIGAEEMDKRLMSIAENYPTAVRYSLMNLIGTHDTMRIKSLFGGNGKNCGDKRLPSGLEDLAIYRVKCAIFLQMTYVGVPSIYYGDEIGMQGGCDPYNRAPFDWRNVDMDLLDTVKAMAKLRCEEKVLQIGDYKTLYADGGVFAFARYFKDGKDVFGNMADDDVIICAVNRDFEEKRIKINVSELGCEELYIAFGSGEVSSTGDGGVELTVPPVRFLLAKGRVL